LWSTLCHRMANFLRRCDSSLQPMAHSRTVPPSDASSSARVTSSPPATFLRDLWMSSSDSRTTLLWTFRCTWKGTESKGLTPLCCCFFFFFFFFFFVCFVLFCGFFGLFFFFFLLSSSSPSSLLLYFLHSVSYKYIHQNRHVEALRFSSCFETPSTKVFPSKCWTTLACNTFPST